MTLKHLFVSVVFLGFCASANGLDSASIVWPSADKRASISGPFSGSDIVVSISSRTAGAVDSIVWSGKEFVDRFDHGREFQAAASYEGRGECLNPTEAGSGQDGAGEQSSSRLLSLQVGTQWLQTTTQMAYWIKHGGKSRNCHGFVSQVAAPLSEDYLVKKVVIGAYGIANVIEFQLTFNSGSARSKGRFEAITGYMPIEFSDFYVYRPGDGELLPLDDGPGDQQLPIIFTTKDHRYALGVVSPASLNDAGRVASYGRFRFADNKAPTVKWNCYFRAETVPPGPHKFSCLIALGDIEDVRKALGSLTAQLGR